MLAGAAFAATALSAQPAPSIGRASFYTEWDFRGEYLVVEAPNTIENTPMSKNSALGTWISPSSGR